MLSSALRCGDYIPRLGVHREANGAAGRRGKNLGSVPGQASRKEGVS